MASGGMYLRMHQKQLRESKIQNFKGDLRMTISIFKFLTDFDSFSGAH